MKNIETFIDFIGVIDTSVKRIDFEFGIDKIESADIIDCYIVSIERRFSLGLLKFFLLYNF